MARTVEEIYLSISNELTNQAELAGLLPENDNLQQFLDDMASLSNVSDHRLQVFATAVAMNTTEVLNDIIQSDIQLTADAATPGTDPWWNREIKKFQFGDDLITKKLSLGDNEIEVIGYAVEDESKQIIKFSSISSSDGKSFLKMAKDDGFGEPTPLTTPELDAASAFIDRQMGSGSSIVGLSQNADLSKYVIDVYYNPLVIANDGSLISDGGIFPIEDAIRNYHANLDFDGTIVIQKLQDDIQAVTGVNDLLINSAEAKPVGGVFTEFDRIYATIAGYVKIDPAFPLSATLNYIPS